MLISFEDNTSLVFNFLNDDLEEFLRLIEAKQNEKSEKLNFMRLNRIEFYLKKFSASAQQSQIDDLVSKWRNGEVSNFRYLMLLNKHAGRCYLDPSNYPVMPWVVAHTSHAHIEYRDLSCTVGALVYLFINVGQLIT